ncbi:MAG: hypothetical protein ACYC35_00590 [Pirellulales bacterium]
MPPNVKPRWDDNGPYTQALIVAFEQLSSHDESEHDAQMLGAGMPLGPKKPRA